MGEGSDRMEHAPRQREWTLVRVLTNGLLTNEELLLQILDLTILLILGTVVF